MLADINNQLTQAEDLGLRLTAVDTNGFLPLELSLRLAPPCAFRRCIVTLLQQGSASGSYGPE